MLGHLGLLTLLVSCLLSVTSATTVSTTEISPSEHRYMPREILESVGHYIPDGKTLHNFRLLNKHAHKYVQENFPGSETCKRFKSYIVGIVRNPSNKAVTFAHTTMNDLLDDLGSKRQHLEAVAMAGRQPFSTNRSMNRSIQNSKPQATKPRASDRVYRGVKAFYLCLNSLSQEDWNIYGFEQEDVVKFNRRILEEVQDGRRALSLKFPAKFYDVSS